MVYCIVLYIFLESISSQKLSLDDTIVFASDFIRLFDFFDDLYISSLFSMEDLIWTFSYDFAIETC